MKQVYSFLLTVFLLIYVVSVSGFVLQDTESPCFYCHADLFFETQDGIHEQNGINCVSCHGKSEEHTLAEDNRIKPEKIYKKAEIANFCGECHNDELKDYTLSIHSTIDSSNAIVMPTCSDCHKGHKFEKKISTECCLLCHGDDSKARESTSADKITQEEINHYQVHSLKKQE